MINVGKEVIVREVVVREVVVVATMEEDPAVALTKNLIASLPYRIARCRALEACCLMSRCTRRSEMEKQ